MSARSIRGPVATGLLALVGSHCAVAGVAGVAGVACVVDVAGVACVVDVAGVAPFSLYRIADTVYLQHLVFSANFVHSKSTSAVNLVVADFEST